MTLALLALAVFTFRWLRMLRIIEDTPTSRVRSAAQGYVELEGRVEAARAPLSSPLRAIPCVWWSYRIEELDPEAGRSGEHGRSHECFLIRDGTGACVVDPDRAEIVGVHTETWTRGSQRVQESVIRVGQTLYALGLFRTPEDHAENAAQREIGALISGPFVLSVLGERRLTGRAWFQSITGLIAATIVAVMLWWFLDVRGLT